MFWQSFEFQSARRVDQDKLLNLQPRSDEQLRDFVRVIPTSRPASKDIRTRRLDFADFVEPEPCHALDGACEVLGLAEERRVETYEADVRAYGWEGAVGGSGAAAVREEEEVCCCGGGFALEDDGEGDFGFWDAVPWVGGSVSLCCRLTWM